MLPFYPVTVSLKDGCYKALDPALPGGQYPVSFSRPWEAELSVLREGQVLLVPHLQRVCVATRWKMTLSPVLQKTGIFVPE